MNPERPRLKVFEADSPSMLEAKFSEWIDSKFVCDMDVKINTVNFSSIHSHKVALVVMYSESVIQKKVTKVNVKK